jgi:aminoglycoside/choline kinase family phosphotransferase
LVSHGCPVPAIEVAFDLQAQTAREWVDAAGAHAEAVHQTQVVQPRDLMQVQADESHVKTAPAVLAVGDVHVENFGTWRDREGRLTWGINDFDEAYTLPYTNDLVRLASSAQLAIVAGHLSLEASAVSKAMLAGYTEGLQAGGRPFVLAEHHQHRHTMRPNLRRSFKLFGVFRLEYPESTGRFINQCPNRTQFLRECVRLICG